MMYTDGAQCTANFVFTNGASVYVGYAAHCAGTGAATDTNGCDAGSLPLGTRVDFVEGGSLVSDGTRVGGGTLVYSSWLAMQANNETDPNACDYNDFAVVEVDAADVSKVNPSIPSWGGPTGIDTNGTIAGDTVYTYGNSSLRGGIARSRPSRGEASGTTVTVGRTTSTPRPRASRATRAARSSTTRAGHSAPSPPCSSPRSPARTVWATSPRSWRTPKPTASPASPSPRARSRSHPASERQGRRRDA